MHSIGSSGTGTAGGEHLSVVAREVCMGQHEGLQGREVGEMGGQQGSATCTERVGGQPDGAQSSCVRQVWRQCLHALCCHAHIRQIEILHTASSFNYIYIYIYIYMWHV